MWCAARPARVATLWLCRVQTAYPLISPLQPARVSSLYTFPCYLVAYARALEVSSQLSLPRATHLSLKTIACLLLTSCGSTFPCFLSLQCSRRASKGGNATEISPSSPSSCAASKEVRVQGSAATRSGAAAARV
jgi:hypothetical protein